MQVLLSSWEPGTQFPREDLPFSSLPPSYSSGVCKRAPRYTITHRWHSIFTCVGLRCSWHTELYTPPVLEGPVLWSSLLLTILPSWWPSTGLTSVCHIVCYIVLVLGFPKLDTIVSGLKCWMRRNDLIHALANIAQCTAGLSSCKGTLQSCLPASWPQPVLLHGIILHRLPLLNITKFLLTHFSSLLKSLWTAARPSSILTSSLWFAIICQLAEGVLYPIAQVFNEDGKQYLLSINP